MEPKQNPYRPPSAHVSDVSDKSPDDFEYAGFWMRLGAYLIDVVILLVITIPLSLAVYGSAYFRPDKGILAGPADAFISWGLPLLFTILFWRFKSATPGKMALSLKIVDAETLQPISWGKSIGRYLGYFVSALVIFLGFFWIGWDARKQGWHDKIAGTLVIRVYK